MDEDLRRLMPMDRALRAELRSFNAVHCGASLEGK